MYLDHFGFNELPFNLTPNTHFFLNLPTHQDALNLVLVALENGDGFVKVVGEVGTGKTLLCRKLLNALPDIYFSAYIPNPDLTPNGLRVTFARELKCNTDELKGVYDLSERINQRLLELAAENKRVVLIIDEAQTMPEETLETLRLLTNLETETRKLFQVILFGQPELNEVLKRQSLRQLRQRITFSHQIRPLDLASTGQYINHRIAQTGYNGMPIFDQKAIKLIHRAAAGTPRLINVLCHKTLMSAYGKGERQTSARHAKSAIADTESASNHTTGTFALTSPLTWLAAVGSLALVAISVWFLQGHVL